MKQQAQNHHHKTQQSLNLSRSNTAQILKMQHQIKKLKKLINKREQMQDRDASSYEKMNKQLIRMQKQLRQKKQQVLLQNMIELQQKKTQRQIKNIQSNSNLTKIKQKFKQRRQRLQSIIDQYKNQYNYLYTKKLQQRRKMINLDLHNILIHQNQYLSLLQKRKKIRIKTQSDNNSNRINFRKLATQSSQHSSSPHIQQIKDSKRLKIIQLMNKKKSYGNRVQKQAKNIKVPEQLLKKLKQIPHDYEDKQKKLFLQQLKKKKKCKLDTNLKGKINFLKNKEINDMQFKQTSAQSKLLRLKNIADGYKQKYNYGHQEAFQLICSANIARAKIFLKEAQKS